MCLSRVQKGIPGLTRLCACIRDVTVVCEMRQSIATSFQSNSAKCTFVIVKHCYKYMIIDIVLGRENLVCIIDNLNMSKSKTSYVTHFKFWVTHVQGPLIDTRFFLPIGDKQDFIVLWVKMSTIVAGKVFETCTNVVRSICISCLIQPSIAALW